MNCNVVNWAPFHFDRDRLKEGERENLSTKKAERGEGRIPLEWATVSGVSSDDAMRLRAPELHGVAVVPVSVGRSRDASLAIALLCNRGENVVMPD